MDATQTQDLDQRIARLEAELAQLQVQRTRQLGRKPKPLDGVGILDMSRFIFGPSCAQMLGDMGADVIKVEPLRGDPARGSGNVRVAGDISSFRVKWGHLRHSWANTRMRFYGNSDTMTRTSTACVETRWLEC